ncbi:MAG TPA: DUF4956 domain-containing protein [Gemmatimonadales bacterium]|nr:DUF4956 domain-containing protein [Gemmatimonadales bacterium]
MGWLKRLLDTLSLGSERPVRRLLAYYAVLAGVTGILLHFFPIVDRVVFSGERLQELTQGAQTLQDTVAIHRLPGLAPIGLPPRLDLVLSTALSLLGTLLLMLPVSWVYMSVPRAKGHNQALVQALIILPIVVAGIILVVRNSLALAFSLAGVVAGVRFRTRVEDAREVTFIFLAIAVGFAAGVQVMTVAALVSFIFNFVLLATWRYGFGRNALEPTAAAQWAEPLNELAGASGGEEVPDRDLVVALTPKKIAALEERFDRVRALVGPDGKKPKYDSLVTITTRRISEAQPLIEQVLEQAVKRWTLNEVVTNEGTPSELYYLVRMRKSVTRDKLLTAIRAAAGDAVESADVELGAAATAKEQG